MAPRSNKMKRPWYWRVGYWVSATVLTGFAVWFIFGETGVYASHKLRTRKAEQDAQLRELKLRQQYLERYLTDLKANKQTALERAAREHGLIGVNETMYQIKVEPQTQK